MNAELLHDMSQRTSTIALFGELFMLLRSKSQSLSGYGFEKTEDQIMLVFLTLRIIMEKTLAEESCTLDDLSASLTELNADLFHLPLSYESLRSIANLIVDQILSNGGEVIEFRAFDQDEFYAHPMYLNSSVIYEGNVKKASYRLSEDGFRLMLSTLEMEENMQLQFRDLVLKMQLERKNYSRALDEIRHIFEILKMKEIEFQDKLAQVRSDASLLSTSTYQAMIDENFQIMEDSEERFKHYSADVRSQIDELNEKLEKSALEGEDYTNLQMLRKIHELLQRSLLALNSILKTLINFSSAFSDELSLQLRSSAFRKYSFTRLVMDPVFENSDLLEQMDTFLHALFIRNPEPQFSLYPAFEYRQLIAREDDDDFEEADEEYDLQAHERRKEALRLQKEQLNESVRMFLEALLEKEDGRLTLAEYGQPEGFVHDSDQARILLSSFASAKTVSISDLKEDRENLVIDEEIPYSFSLALMENYEKLEKLGDYDYLKIRKAPGKAVYTFDLPDEEGSQSLPASPLSFPTLDELDDSVSEDLNLEDESANGLQFSVTITIDNLCFSLEKEPEDRKKRRKRNAGQTADRDRNE
ncbi:hypothetical protein [Allobaculum mucilyticum]|uniref:hypothetical protein n=1 Tax=Allobaculum mucilyticum TaxID=2834459 RepID=UPI001E29DAF7|nr:hypothetical protein [Allobaculum mucilyticum]UNT97131.1 hypothetical protein KWG62_05120 [Allobaculum mucilyticum]